MYVKRTSWTTRDEIEFIKHLGKWTLKSRQGKISHLQHLYLYANAAQNRVNWEEIDKRQINKYLSNRI